ncbi:ABC transporter permease subunit [Agromyces atrinae]|uniref:ABC transporter permease n=1 Tax=Agromyces atrinae TaxID=592376 RepID=UPI001F561553|nr:ABC transporter permease subunit [Agromyces atrinae]MCI2956532.1 ABC transporter permease subunit [Agromyces atrinae]
MTTPGRLVTALAVLLVAALSVPPIVVLVVQACLGREAQTVTPARLVELLGNTLLLALLVVVASSVIGTATALLTQRTTLPGRRVWAVLVAVPLVLPAYVFAVALSGMIGGGGVVTSWLAPFGVDRLPPATGLWAATACLTIVSVPIVHTLVATALARLDPALDESARLLGDRPARVILRVVLPQLRGTLALAACVVSLYVISDFGAVSMLRYDTFTRAIYAQFRGRVDLAPAFALCAVLVLVAAALIVGQIVLRGRELAVAARARPPRPVALGPAGRLAGTVFLGLVVLGSTVLPVATLVTWTVRGLVNGAQPGPVIAEAVNALLFAFLAALVTTAIAIPVALAARRRGALARAIEGVPWVTHSLPHLAIGLAILVLAIAGPAFLYQSVTTLTLAYAVVFLPLAVGAILVALRQIDPRLLEVSRSLGHSSASTAVRVVAPLTRRAVLAGAALVFFAAVHELPVTLLLRPTGSETLAIRVWGAVVEGQYTTASIAALLLVALSVPLLALHERASLRAAVAA